MTRPVMTNNKRPEASMTAQSPPRHYKPLVLSIISATFLCYLCVGMSLVVLPLYVSQVLGQGAVMVGIVISLQFVATLCARPLAGRVADRVGAKQSVVAGLVGCALSGMLVWLSMLLVGHAASIVLLLIGRVVLGFSQGLIGTGTLSWTIGIAGSRRMGKVISWNGIAAYGSMAVGAPLGMSLVGLFGYWSLGVATTLATGLGALFVCRLKAAPLVPGKRLSFLSVFARIAPYGLALGLSNIGFGVIATFITLYYASQGWEHAAWGLTAFSLAFVAARLLLAGVIERFGGYRIAMACCATEGLGMVLLWLAPSAGWALCGALIAGFGISLIYPALGVVAVKNVPESNRSAALGAYSLCLDLSVGLTGPLAGAVAGGFGYAIIYGLAALAAYLAVALVLVLFRRSLARAAEVERQAGRADG